MVKLSALRTDLNKENKGVWVDWVAGVRFKIARMNNDAFDAFIIERQKASIGRLRKKKQGTDEEKEAMMYEAIARTVLLDWEGVEDEATGEPLKYTPERGIAALSDPEQKDMFRFIVRSAGDSDNYRQEFLEQASGN